MGTLKITGKIALKQFWPAGHSDADTTKLMIKVGKDAFQFAADGKNFKPTKIFVDAKVKGKGRPTAVVKNKNLLYPTITIRLQGVDAPELHYNIVGQPSKKVPGTKLQLSDAQFNKVKKENKPQYRQYMAETATVQLAAKLAKYADDKGELTCTFISHNIESPSDVCDIYGRFVGDILVNEDQLNVNQWLLRQGLAFPAYYTSMREAEIKALTVEVKKARLRKTNVWGLYSPKVDKFNWELQCRESDKPKQKDTGKIVLPKLFRRQYIFALYEKAGVQLGSFTTFMNFQKEDKVILTQYIGQYHKASDANKKMLESPLSYYLSNDSLTRQPEELTFTEKDCKLIGANAKEITKF